MIRLYKIHVVFVFGPSFAHASAEAPRSWTLGVRSHAAAAPPVRSSTLERLGAGGGGTGLAASRAAALAETSNSIPFALSASPAPTRRLEAPPSLQCRAHGRLLAAAGARSAGRCA